MKKEKYGSFEESIEKNFFTKQKLFIYSHIVSQPVGKGEGKTTRDGGIGAANPERTAFQPAE